MSYYHLRICKSSLVWANTFFLLLLFCFLYCYGLLILLLSTKSKLGPKEFSWVHVNYFSKDVYFLWLLPNELVTQCWPLSGLSQLLDRTWRILTCSRTPKTLPEMIPIITSRWRTFWRPLPLSLIYHGCRCLPDNPQHKTMSWSQSQLFIMRKTDLLGVDLIYLFAKFRQKGMVFGNWNGFSLNYSAWII